MPCGSHHAEARAEKWDSSAEETDEGEGEDSVAVERLWIGGRRRRNERLRRDKERTAIVSV